MKRKLVFLLCLAGSSTAVASGGELTLRSGSAAPIAGVLVRCEGGANRCSVREAYSRYRVLGADGYPLSEPVSTVGSAVADLKRLINDGVCSRN